MYLSITKTSYGEVSGIVPFFAQLFGERFHLWILCQG